MSKVKVLVEHDGIKHEFECDFLLMAAANDDYPRLATRTQVTGVADILDLNRAYVALGTAMHKINVNEIYQADIEQATELVNDLMETLEDK